MLLLLLGLFCCGAMMVCWTCAAPHQHNPPSTGPGSSPCYVDDLLAALREGLGADGQLTNGSRAAFGVCAAASGGSLARELAREAEGGRLEVLHLTGGRRSTRSDSLNGGGETLAGSVSPSAAGDDGRGGLSLTFDLPPAPVPRLEPVLGLGLQRPSEGEDLEVTFTSLSMQPHTQSVCISAETRYVLLRGVTSVANVDQKWTISVEARSPDQKQKVVDVLCGERAGDCVNITPLLLFSGGTDTRNASSNTWSQTFSFLCELRRFLYEVQPGGFHPGGSHPGGSQPGGSHQLQLDSLQSLAPQALGPTSSESLLAGLINSSSPTVFSFRGWAPRGHHGELSLSPALQEELRLRVEDLSRAVEAEEGGGAAERLRRLRELSALPEKEPAAGESQYRAFLLLKALRTASPSLRQRSGPRTARAGPGAAASRQSHCALRPLTVSLATYVVGPDAAAINNCRGSCSFPLLNGNNHAVLLNMHVEGGAPEERPPCCVPVAYDPLEVVDLNERGTFLSVKPDFVAKECGCR